MRKQIERNKMKRTEEGFWIYLNKDAPLGHDEEAR